MFYEIFMEIMNMEIHFKILKVFINFNPLIKPTQISKFYNTSLSFQLLLLTESDEFMIKSFNYTIFS